MSARVPAPVAILLSAMVFLAAWLLAARGGAERGLGVRMRGHLAG